MPCCVIHFIIIQFIYMKNNATQIMNQCKLKFKKTPSLNTIGNILNNLRKAITEHLKFKYRRIQIGWSPDHICGHILNKN